jgi:hypothetical protein
MTVCHMQPPYATVVAHDDFRTAVGHGEWLLGQPQWMSIYSL